MAAFSHVSQGYQMLSVGEKQHCENNSVCVGLGMVF